MFRAIKMFNPYPELQAVEKALSILGLFFFVLGIVFRYSIIKDRELTHQLADLFFAFSIAAWFYPIFAFIFEKWPAGYLLEKDRIVFHCKYRKNELLYEDIQCIIISNTIVRSRITKTPWITMVGERSDEIIQYLMSENRKYVLRDVDIKCKLGEKIGWFHYEYIWKIFKKGSSTIYNYGFGWNKQEIHKVLDGFRGDYYIAASVISNYSDEMNAIRKQYDIDNQRIHIIDDSTNGEFIWR